MSHFNADRNIFNWLLANNKLKNEMTEVTNFLRENCCQLPSKFPFKFHHFDTIRAGYHRCDRKILIRGIF